MQISTAISSGARHRLCRARMPYGRQTVNASELHTDWVWLWRPENWRHPLVSRHGRWTKLAGAAGWAFEQWLSMRGGSEPAEARQAIRQVRLFIEQFGESRFDPLDQPDARPSLNRAGWRKGQGEDQEWLVSAEIWRTEICEGLNPTVVVRALCDRGMLEKARDGFQPVRKIEGENRRATSSMRAHLCSGGRK